MTQPSVSAASASAGASIGVAPIPFKQEAPLAASPLGGGAVLVLLVSLLVIGVVLYLRRRLNLAPAAAAGAPRLLRVLERQPLGPRAVLLVVEFDGERLLLAHTEHGVTRLAQGKEAP
ncbi:Flagellar biosynthesis protein, FliO [Duganella sp. CF458]|uniref:flagellar biosynthetic protein FliO n=1 Tax=Duganella sp. CF458 TaxID=1884368 RepID=UPI0008EBEBA9|nr:flagellar biosynthetic protein FliO [Duganella sp. CF458]SFG88898.1 Flagellar biosynthesis protein, FliO [Duganella sp. CF458]